MPLPPTVLSLILCDNVHRDAGTGKFFYLGSFSMFGVSGFPATVPLFFACFALTDGTGRQEVRVQVVDASQVAAEPLGVEGVMAVFPNRFAVLETAVAFRGLTFPAAGEYRVQLVVAGELLMERRIVLMPYPQPSTRSEP